MNARILSPTVSVVVSDLSKNGAGRWGDGVRPFLLVQALKKLGCAVKLVGFMPRGATPIPSIPDLSITAISASPYPHFFQSAQALWRHLDGDIIYAYKPKPTSFGVSFLHHLKTKRPLLLDIDDWEMSWHGGDDWQYRPTPKQLARDIFNANGALRQPDHPVYLKWLETQVSRASAITIHTKFLQQRFGGFYVPNGKDVSLFDPSRYDSISLKQRYQLTAYRTLMFPGASRPYKGLEDVLMALDLLNQPDLRLVIVGGSPYDDYDQQLMQQWQRWIIKIPTVPYELMPEVIAAADVIVVPQRDTPATHAQFPLKLTDGMAMAKPILSTYVGDIPDILEDTGYLVDPNSPEQLAAAIEHIFIHPEEARDRGQKARTRCVNYYSIEAMSKQLSQVIELLF
jgi:glycosyltransferase involved in cell wall biosynthesis